MTGNDTTGAAVTPLTAASAPSPAVNDPAQLNWALLFPHR